MRIENAEKVVGKLNEMIRVCSSIPKNFAELIRQEALKIAPKKTGRLRESILVRRRRRGYEVVMGGSKAPYAPIIELGSRPHRIRARRCKALRFEVDGEIVYAKYVTHPGTKPQRIMARSISEASKALSRELSKIFQTI